MDHSVLPNFKDSLDSISSDSFENLQHLTNDDEDSNSDRFKATALIYKTIDDIFKEQQGLHKESSSAEVSSKHESEYSFDRRLQYWKDTLKSRQLMREKIQKKVGKLSSEILFDRTTIEDRDKSIMKNILEFNESKNHIKDSVEPNSILPAKCDVPNQRYLEELHGTHPNLDNRHLEIIGIPKHTRLEILGTFSKGHVTSKWLNSPLLEEYITENFESICCVLEFYPRLELLEVIGTQITPNMNLTKFIGSEDVRTISTIPDSQSGYENTDDKSSVRSSLRRKRSTSSFIRKGSLTANEIKHSVKINKDFYCYTRKRNPQCNEVVAVFKCEPFQRVVKVVLNLRNCGNQVIGFALTKYGFYSRNDTLFASDDEFVFDSTSFRLGAQESRELYAMFHPKKVGIFKERWLLAIKSKQLRAQFMLYIKFHGQCTAPTEYLNLLDEKQHLTLQNSYNLCQKNLLNHMLVPLIQPQETYCPYERVFDDLEIFNLQNKGFSIKRFDDIEVLKKLYHQLKKPRDPPWNLNLQSLKQKIYRLPNPSERREYFKEFIQILDNLRGESINQMDEDLEERYLVQAHSRFIYVRGIVSNAIEVWENMIWDIEMRFLKPELQRYYVNMLNEENEEETLSHDTEPVRSLSETSVIRNILKDLRYSKYFRDSIYMHTYTQLCDVAEIIVSVIESTKVV